MFPYMAEKSTTLTLTAAEKDCFIEFGSIAIGGGGDYVYVNGKGAGSGYIEAKKFRLSVNSPVMTVTVGGGGQSSKVEVGEEVIVEADPGASPDDVRAGAGYSGGGGKNGGRGGSNGEDGEDGDQRAGGHGSGLDIGLLSTENFILTPGDGGEAYSDGTGGGGGGVVVNGKMPGDSPTGGKGYGGGGSWDGDVMNGYPGCVLLEK